MNLNLYLTGGRKCRELWPLEQVFYERIYNIFLDLILFMLPLIILCFAYFSIIRTLYKGIQNEDIRQPHAMNNLNNNDVQVLSTEEEYDEMEINRSEQFVGTISSIKRDYGESFYLNMNSFLIYNKIQIYLKI